MPELSAISSQLAALCSHNRGKFVWTRSRGARLGLTCAIAIAADLAAATTAWAQIYAWRDANGNMVLSNRRPAATSVLKSYAVPTAQAVRTTRYAALDRSRLYDDLIVENARLNSVRTDLVRAVVQVESAFNPYARSPKGAMGLMQIMPATAKQFGVVDPYNPVENVRAGVAYLRELLDRFQQNEELALAAYNAGPGAVDKHGQQVPPYAETRSYVAHINRIARPTIEMRGTRIYRVIELVDGREVTRYTDQKPTSGTYEVVTR